MDLKKLDQKTLKKGIADKGWNIHLPNPLKPQETVWIHQDQTGIDTRQYVRIIHSEPNVVSVFSKRYFE